MKTFQTLAASLLALITLPPAPTHAQGGVSSYCQSGAGGATISASGSTDFNANGGSGDLLLHASGLPTGAFGLFFYGAQAQAPTPLGNGFLCVGGGAPLWRFGVVTTGTGTTSVSSAVDYLLPPDPAAQITSGSTWNFQFWFRSAGTSDTTDALQIQFVPPVSLSPVATIMHLQHTGHPLGHSPGGVVVMNTPAELQSFWNLHTVGFQPPPPLPPVDMNQSTVIAVFLGWRPTLGFDINITDVALSVTTLHVSSDETIPCGGVLFSESNPMMMVAVRRVPGATFGSWAPTTIGCP